MHFYFHIFENSEEENSIEKKRVQFLSLPGGNEALESGIKKGWSDFYIKDIKCIKDT